MKNLFSKFLFGLLGISIGMYVVGSGLAYAAAFLVASGGTGTTSVPVNQILTGNGTSAFNSNTATGTSPYGINVLSGCLAVNGTCLTSSGGTMTSIGLGFGATNTVYAILATTTSATNGETSALTITNSGNTYTFTPSQSGTRTVQGGGTGAATLTGCLTGNGTGAITGSGTCNTSAASVTSVGLSSSNSTLTIGSTPVTTSGTITADLNLAHTNTWTILQNFSNASTSQLSVFQKAYFGGSATTTIDSTGALTIATLNVNTIPNATTTNFTASQSIGEAGNNIPAFFYGSFSFATTTAWTGSTTPVAAGISLGLAGIAETWDSVSCKTNVGTTNVQFYNGATQILPMFNASTTGGTVTFTSGNAITAGTERFFIAGTPASSPVQIGCTVKKHYTF